MADRKPRKSSADKSSAGKSSAGKSSAGKSARKQRKVAVSERAPAPAAGPSRQLDTFANPAPDRDYEITFECPEFTCLCPLTGQPDFATFEITYVPDARCLELKSLKLYLWSYRDEGAFHEAVTNQILDDLVTACQPRMLEITGDWYVRGGITTRVRATHIDPRWGGRQD